MESVRVHAFRSNGMSLLFFEFLFDDLLSKNPKGIANLYFRIDVHQLSNTKMWHPIKSLSLCFWRSRNAILSTINVNGGDSLQNLRLIRSMQDRLLEHDFGL